MEEPKLDPKVEEALKESGITYKVFQCDPELADTYAFCEHYDFKLGQSANTIIVASKKEPVVFGCCVILATTKLDVNKKVCQLLGVKDASFASAEQTIEKTGMQIGGVTAFGVKDMPIYIDGAVLNNQEIVMGGGNRSTKVLLDPKELQKLTTVQIIENLAKPKVE
jgi:prolyl-tRNA editing enzyme YbaK/EbsC (Cys-tRNA(Pro) deacylase)